MFGFPLNSVSTFHMVLSWEGKGYDGHLQKPQ